MKAFHFLVHAFILFIAILLFPFIFLIALIWYREDGIGSTLAFVYKEYASACIDFPPPD